MPRPIVGVRWWLGVAFAVVAATSTAIVVSQFSNNSENAFRRHAENLALLDANTAAKRDVTPANRDRVASKLQGSVTLRLFRAAEAAPGGLEREGVTAALGGDEFVHGTSDGGTYIAAVPYRGGALIAISRQPATAEAIDTVNGETLRAGVIAGVIGVIVGLLFAQLIALRLRRLSAAAEGIAHGDFETPLRYRFRDEFGLLAHNLDRMRRQLRRSFRRIEAERDRLQILLERLQEGVLTIDQDLVVHFANAEARRILGGRLREGDELPEPWQGFGLRAFAQGLFDERSAVTQVHVTPDEQHAYGLVGIPSQPETDWALLVVDDLTEQERRELAEREFVSNAAHELRTPLTTIIGAVEALQAGAKEDPGARPLPRSDRARGRPARTTRPLAARPGPRARGAGAAARRGGRARGRCCARSPRASVRTRRRGRHRGRERPRGRGESRSPRAGAAQPCRQRREVHGARPRRAPRLRATGAR